MDIHFRLGINLKDTTLHHFCFVFANCISRRNNLAIQITHAYFIIINQIKLSDSASHKRFTYISTDTTNTKHGNAGAFQLVHCFLT